MLDDARRDTKFGHHNARSQSLRCGMIIDEKRPNGLDVLAAMGLRLLRFLTGWARNNMSAIEAEADSATACEMSGTKRKLRN